MTVEARSIPQWGAWQSVDGGSSDGALPARPEYYTEKFDEAVKSKSVTAAQIREAVDALLAEGARPAGGNVAPPPPLPELRLPTPEEVRAAEQELLPRQLSKRRGPPLLTPRSPLPPSSTPRDIAAGRPILPASSPTYGAATAAGNSFRALPSSASLAKVPSPSLDAGGGAPPVPPLRELLQRPLSPTRHLKPFFVDEPAPPSPSSQDWTAPEGQLLLSSAHHGDGGGGGGGTSRAKSPAGIRTLGALLSPKRSARHPQRSPAVSPLRLHASFTPTSTPSVVAIAGHGGGGGVSPDEDEDVWAAADGGSHPLCSPRSVHSLVQSLKGLAGGGSGWRQQSARGRRQLADMDDLLEALPPDGRLAAARFQDPPTINVEPNRLFPLDGATTSLSGGGPLRHAAARTAARADSASSSADHSAESSSYFHSGESNSSASSSQAFLAPTTPSSVPKFGFWSTSFQEGRVATAPPPEVPTRAQTAPAGLPSAARPVSAARKSGRVAPRAPQRGASSAGVTPSGNGPAAVNNGPSDSSVQQQEQRGGAAPPPGFTGEFERLREARRERLGLPPARRSMTAEEFEQRLKGGAVSVVESEAGAGSSAVEAAAAPAAAAAAGEPGRMSLKEDLARFDKSQVAKPAMRKGRSFSFRKLFSSAA